MIRTEIALDIGSRRTKLAIKNRNMLPLLGKNADDTVLKGRTKKYRFRLMQLGETRTQKTYLTFSPSTM